NRRVELRNSWVTELIFTHVRSFELLENFFVGQRNASFVIRSYAAQENFRHLLIETRQRNRGILLRHSFFDLRRLQRNTSGRVQNLDRLDVTSRSAVDEISNAQ